MKENCFGEKLDAILDTQYGSDYRNPYQRQTANMIIELIKTDLLPVSPRTGMEIDDVLAEVDGFEQCLTTILSKLEVKE